MDNEEKFLDYLKRATADLRKARRRVRELEEREQEPVAIVGIGCRFPGGAGDPEGFWRVLADGVDAISGFPVDRGWDTQGIYGEAADSGASTTRQGGFVYDASGFDAAFFGISPREALAMDPQQRVLLEASWEALEQAGIDPGTLRGSATGVFAGAGFSAYGAAVPASDAEGYVVTGNATSVISGRVAYTLGLEGPAVTVDTACSSSLVALHLAAQALRTGECTLALAGGVTVMAEPGTFAEFSRQGGLAFDGRCKAFADGADGTGWGEGVGMLVVERLADARRNGHRVLAVLRGSAVNQDGASNGLTAPNGPSQQRVIRAALANARLSAAEVDAVEAHGTGTVLGDPIEAQAILATYGQDRPEDQPLWLGSVKSNIGHTQAAAGIAGAIKMILAMQHGVLPRTLHAENPSPYVDWTAGQVRLLNEPVPWPADGRPRRAGISAFGISGTNAHIILEEAPAPAPAEDQGSTPDSLDDAAETEPAPAPETPKPAVLQGETAAWLVSGQSPEGLRAQASRLAAHLAARPETAVADAAWSLATTRPALEHRAVVLGSDRGELLATVTALAGSAPSAALVTGVAESARRVVFVFPGQGSQWIGMGRELAQASPVFAARLAECEQALSPHVDWSLTQVLAGADGAPGFDRVDVVQPVLWAVMVSLAELWQAAGVKPDAVLGHSQGEIAAAVVAGILSLDDAAKVVALRSKALISLSGAGGMLSLAAPADAVAARLGSVPGQLSVAAVNGPQATVVSGEPAALAELAAGFERDGIRTRLLPVDYASHGPQVDAIREEVLGLLAGLTPQPAKVPMISAMSGDYLEGPEADAEYWYASLRAPVQFARAVQTLGQAEYGAFIEVSAHPVLTTAITATLETEDGSAGPVVSGTLRRDDGGPARVLASLAEAYVRGVAVHWPSVLTEGERVPLPTYAFQHRYFWPKPLPAGAVAAGRPDPVSEGEARFWAAIEADDVGSLAEALAVESGWPFSDVVPAMATWRRREREQSAVADWRYRVAWVPVADPAPATLSGTWLLLTPADGPAGSSDTGTGTGAATGTATGDGPAGSSDTGTADRPTAIQRALTGASDIDAGTDDGLTGFVRRALTARGADVVTLRVTPAAADRDTLAAHLTAAAGPGLRPSGVVSLLALDEAPLAGRPVVAAGLAGTLGLVQALGDAALTAPLWLLTSGAVASGPDDTLTSPIQAQVWGIGRVAGLEHPDRWGGLVDLPPVLDDRAAERFAAVLAGCGEDQLVIRPGGIKARRLVRANARRTENDQPWTTTGSVLLTGASGAIGPDLAAWLAQSKVPHAVLASRRGPLTPGAAILAATMAEAGTAVTMAGCDVSVRAQVAGLLHWIPAVAGPLSVVIHAAVAVELTPLKDVDLDELETASSAKVAGAAHLDELTADLNLDAFVLFSSITATWGVSDHGSYAAANAYLDALAENRRSRGLPATSVAWGVWDSGGRFAEAPAAGAPDEAVHTEQWLPQSLIPERLRRQGLRLLDPDRALTALSRLMAADETVLAVADVDWPRFSAVFNAARSWRLLDEIPEARQTVAEPNAPVAVSGEAAGLLARLLGVSAAQRERIVTDLVRGHAAAVLGHSSPSSVQAARAFRDMGFDSLTAVELRGRLNQATGLQLPSTVVFDYPSPLVLARQILTRLVGSAALAADGSAHDGGRVTPVSSADPVVIVGMGCRFPGNVDSPEGLWRLLVDGADAISGFPPDRGWDLTALLGADAGGPGYTPEGGFLTGMADFDPGFFRISPREALGMDPQQRLLLETSWEALERAGIDPVDLRGSLTGVFTGASNSGYAGQAGFGAGVEGSEGHLMIGNLTSVISGRVSYTLGLEGPAVTVDTACSSALVSLHLAAQALRGGECDLALAGGVMVITDPTEFIGFSQQGALAADARCKAFSADADGMSLSEGVGILVMERLSDARRNGHPVLAVVAGSAVNQDGASNGLSAPNGPSQQRVIRAALASAGLKPGDVDVIEAHGTGTALGDPIEAQAILATYGQDRPENRPLLLGSVKSNIGHAQQAAGVAGVMKMVLALQHDLVPATLHADVPSPHVDWAAGHVRLLQQPMPWPAGWPDQDADDEDRRPRRAGVSAFGISGTNAHLILEEPPAAPAPTAADTEPDPDSDGMEGPADAELTEPELLAGGALAWLVSGHTPAGLTDQAARLAAHLEGNPQLDPADVAWSLAHTRTALEHRAVLQGQTRDELLAALSALAAGDPSPALVTGTATAAGPVVFVFPGQGGQWVGMGQELARTSPVFAARLAECGAALSPYVDWDLAEVLAAGPDAPSLTRLDVVHPALWAIMVSLSAVWEAAGVRPDAVIGHSQGEIAAAVVSGVLSLSDGARVVARRGQAMLAMAGKGGVLSIAESLEAVEARLRAGKSTATVATINGPESIAVSGDIEALQAFAAECERDSVRTRFIPMDYAPHGPQVESIRDAILTALDGITPGPAVIPMISGMTGDYLDGMEAGPDYWYESLRATVQFIRGIERLGRDGYGVFIEVSPHPVLTNGTAATLETADSPDNTAAAPVVTGTLRRDDGGPARLLASLADVHVHGVDVDWAAILPAGRRVDLPTYAFQRQRYWPKPTVATAAGANALGLGAANHPLLGAAVDLAGGQGLLFTGRLSVRTQPWLADHAIAGTVLLPGTAFVELAVRAGYQAGCPRIEELTLAAPLVLPPDGAVRVQVAVGAPDERGQRAVEVYGQAEDPAGDHAWTRHAAGLLAPAQVPAETEPAEFRVWPPEGADPVDLTGRYEAQAEGGYGFGPVFRGLRAAWRRGGEVFAEVALPEDAAADAAGFGLHPALLDACLHAAGLAGDAWTGPIAAGGGQVLLPFAWTGLSLHAAGASRLRVRLSQDPDTGGIALAATDPAGTLVVSADSLVLRPVAAGALQTAGNALNDSLFAVEWTPISAAPIPGSVVCAVTGADPFGLAAGLAGLGARSGAPTQIQTVSHADLAALAQAVEAGAPAPALVFASVDGFGSSAEDAADPAQAARRLTAEVLDLLHRWLTLDALASARLVLVSRGAVATEAGAKLTDLAAAAVWGLVRSAQSENPDRLILADLPTTALDASTFAALAAALGTGEPELAVREHAARGRRLVRSTAPPLAVPADGPWRLDAAEKGTLAGLALVPCPEALAPLGPGQARIAVRAVGLNFRDVLIALGMYPVDALVGTEIAGLVTEIGPGVTHLSAGDRVLGMAAGAAGPLTVADARMLTPMPAEWSFAEAATVPIAYSTAWYALVDLAAARPGQRLLVHAAAGGVGTAAVAVARHLGLDVYATASPAKWDVLRAMGLAEDHIASSRTADFEAAFLAATGGEGMDIVLNALAGELTDASLRLLPRGGTFLEMGKTDVRDPADLAREHPGVQYHAFVTGDAAPERLTGILAETTELVRTGALAKLPRQVWDVRRAPEAFRFMSQARHVGKIVLTVPPDPAAAREPGPVLITGGTGTLGGLVARHLAATGRAREVVLTSRSGPGARGAATLAADLAAAGLPVRILAGDAADRPALAALLAAVKPTGIVHTAGVLDDGVIESLTPERIDAVMRPKADAAWNLHELTQGTDLDLFVLFSAGAATFGAAGQGNYAAGNAFLDALAAHRLAAGLPAVSLAWGLWADASTMTEGLSAREVDRITQNGVGALTADQGLGLLDLALTRDDALLVPARLDVAGIRAQAAQGAELGPLWRALTGGPARPPMAAAAARAGAGTQALLQQLAALSAADRDRMLLDLVRGHVAAVLGHSSPDAVEPRRAFRDLGFDSLTSVELRNRLQAATGLRLPATVVFDHPSATALAEHLRGRLLGDGALTAAPVRATAADEPIAIVAVGCRFPGDVRDPEAFWNLLASGTDAISTLPRDRGWDTAGLADQDPANPTSVSTGQGGFLTGATEFDPGFFGISPREALAMDPQQRLLLETSWEALERAGLDPATLRGSATGVYVGAAFSGYGAGLPPELAGHMMTGTAASVMSGRISYTLGLEGPAVTIDTACSSSLVALHLATAALRAGECTMALAGGATIMATPGGLVSFSQQGALAGDGRCKAFSTSADGMGMAEGAGMLVVERLSDAKRNGHPVLAVIRGSAMNQDGASNGLTAPNGPSQQRVIRAALANARLTTADVDVIEAHGTGTELGDPIEAQALLATYGQDRPEGRPLWLGSVKTNIGHTQCAAGAASVIKMVLALQNEQLPRSLYAEQPSTHVDWTEGDVRLLAEAQPWPVNGRVRRAGVSSFGISGTNVHLVLEEAPAATPTRSGSGSDPDALPVLTGTTTAWPISARTGAGLAGQAGRLGELVAARPELDLEDVAWSLVTSRSAFEHRAVVTGRTREELLSGLTAVAAGLPAAGVVSGMVPVGGAAGRVVFVFPGQGSQWAGMGRELAAASPVFAARLAECGQALSAYVDWSLEDVINARDGAPGLDRVDVVQPVLWAVMVSLAEFWQAAGVRPDAVVGHSQGEIAAAVVAGILSLDDGAKIVALRSRALIALSGRGGMLSIAESADAAAARISTWADRVAVAAVNGPGATVLSGDPEALAEILAECERDGVRARMLPVDYASHGPQVDELRDEILKLLESVTPQPGRLPMVSAMTGEHLQGPEMDAGYWYASLRAPVEFARAIEVLGRAGYGVFVETSPHPVLTAPITATLEGLAAADPVVTGTLRREDGGPARALASLAELHVRGVAVNWTAVLAEAARVDLPTYPFAAERFWPAPAGSSAGDLTSAGLGSVGHPLLGASVELAEGDGLVVTGRLAQRAQPWLADYTVAGITLLPGTALAELAVVAGHQAGCPHLDKLTLTAPLVLSAEHPTRVQITVSTPGDEGLRADQRTVQIYARTETPADPAADAADQAPAWTWHASGVLSPARPAEPALAREFLAWPPADAEPLDLSGLAAAQTAAGHGYGPAFRGLRAAWRHGEDLLAEVVLPEPAAAEAGVFGLHPALLDAAFQATALVADPDDAEAAQTRIPFGWTDLSVFSPGASRLRVRLSPGADGWSLAAADGAGVPVASVGSLTLRPVTAAQLRTAGNTLRDALFGLTWVPVPDPTVAVTGPWAVAGPDLVGLGGGLRAVGATVADHPDLAALAAAVAAGEPVPQFAVACLPTIDAADDPGAAVRRATGEVGALVRQWLALDALAAARLVLVTRGAVATGPDQPAPNLAAAAVWGLVRSLQSGHPGRLILADLAAPADGATDRLSMLAASLTSDDPELALRGDTVYGRRLTRPAGGVLPTNPPAEHTPGRVLLAAGPGTRAARAARHLALTGRATAVTVATRPGPAAAGTAALAADLAIAGADVRIAACDLAAPLDQPGPTALLTARSEARLTTVLYQADTELDADTTPSASAAAPTASAANPSATDAAWNLHRLTADLDLDAFVLFSSLAAVLGAPEASEQASAEAGFLQALAAHRHAAGLPALALAWGPSREATATTSTGNGTGTGTDSDPKQSDAKQPNPQRPAAITDLTEDDALALFDLALDRGEDFLVPARLTPSRLRAPADSGPDRLPAPIWRALAGSVAAAEPEQDHSEVAEALRAQLAAMAAPEQERMLLTMVRAHVAAVLGQGSPEAIEPRRAFSDLGFDSMIAVELRNRLNAATGLKLPATVVFDYPTTLAVAGYLRESLVLDPAGGADAEEDLLRRVLATTALSRFRDAGILDALLRLADPDAAAGRPEDSGRAGDIDELDAESLVRLALDAEGADY